MRLCGLIQRRHPTRKHFGILAGAARRPETRGRMAALAVVEDAAEVAR